MRLRRALPILLALSLAAFTPAALAKFLWLIEEGRLERVDTATSVREIVPMAVSVHAAAPTTEGGAWVLTDEGFVRVDDSLAMRNRTPLPREQLETIGAMAVDGDGGLWYASGPVLAHIDGAGTMDRQIATDGAILAVTVSGPRAVFVASPTSLTRFDSGGNIRGRFRLDRVPGGDTKAILDDRLAGFVWLVREGAVVQFDALFALAARAAIVVPDLGAASLDPATGTLTLLAGREIVRYDRSAAPTGSAVFASEPLSRVLGLATPSRDDVIWFADAAGLGVVDPSDGAVLRFGDATAHGFAVAPLRFEPRLDADVAENESTRASTAVVLNFGVSCDRHPCSPLAPYLQGLRLEARQGGADVTGRFSANGARDRFAGELPIAPSAAAPPLQAWVVDELGNQSNAVTVTWPLPHADPLRHPLAAPTIAITAPLNNSVYTAPLNTTIKATATPSTGAAIAKVDFYAGTTLLGTVAVAPYNFAWSNVQVGAYALTAKVTDSLNATATSAIVNVTVNAGAMAKPLDAYLFNDAWSTTGVVVDAAGVHNGVPTGAAIPVGAGAAAPKPDTCKAASFSGGAIDAGGLAVSTTAGAKTTVAFWMDWNGSDGVMPIGWVTEGLLLNAGSFGFNTQNGDVYGIASSGLTGQWHHVVAEFTNGAVASNKLYLDGVPQVLTQRAGAPNNANAVVAATLRIAGLTNSASYRFAGLLDEVKVFNRALTPAEVSAEFAVANGCGTAPTVSLTAPASNASYVAPATIAMTAAAAPTAAGAPLTKVEFYNGTTLLKTVTASPYAYMWANVPIGDYALTAKATDSKGTTATSAVATVHVKANVPPSVVLTSPPGNSSYTAPATINLAATASDTDGTIAKVEFYQGATRLATVTTPPYAYTWSNVAGGTYSLTAKATDDKGAVTTSTAVTVKVNKLPTISLTAPANNAVVVLPATVTINASASDADGTVSKVEFFHDGVLLGADATSPYSYAWANPPAGTYVLTAKATDNLGAVTASSPVTITVKVNQAPTVSLTSPANGATYLTGIPVTVAANAADADGSIVRVEFYVDVPEFYINHGLFGVDNSAPYSVTNTLNPGHNTFTAVAIDDKGGTATSAPVTITVVQNQPPAVTLMSPAAGQVFVAPSLPDVTVSATAADADGAVTAVRFYKQSEGLNGDPSPVLLATVTAPPYQTTWKAVPYTDLPPGGVNIDVHTVWAEATDTSGAVTRSNTSAIYVWQAPPASAYDVQIKSPYSGLGGSERIVYSPPATVVLSATVTLGLGASSIAKLDFIANGSVVGTVTGPNGSNSEFVSVWRNVPAGHYLVTARSTDAGGFTSTSDAITIDVAATSSPAVVLQSPIGEQVTEYSPGGGAPAIALTASLTDPGGTVAQVELDDNYRGVAYANSAPYTGTLSGGQHGVHVLAASALDGGYRELARSSPAYVVVPQWPRPPLAVMTSPTQGASYSAGTYVTLSVDAIPRDGVITQVTFYSGGTALKTLTGAPFTFSGAFPSGTQSVYADVQSSYSYAVTEPVTFSVGGIANGAAIALTSPVDEQRFAAPATIPLGVSLKDPGGIITRVDYFATVNANRGLKASSTQAPWSATWANVAAGDYVLTAEGVYATGRIKSAPVTVHVLATPSVLFVKPTEGDSFGLGQSISMTAEAITPGHTLSRVEFWADGANLGSVVVPGSASTAMVNFTWSGATIGTHILSAKAVASDGFSIVSAPVDVAVTDLTATLAEPYAGQTYIAPALIRITAYPTETGGTFAQVDFMGDGMLLGSRAAPPYSWVWSGAAAGMHTVSARVYDTTGRVTTTAPVGINVVSTPSVQVSAGLDGSSVTDDSIAISGTVQAPLNSAVAVNGKGAAVDHSGAFFVDSVMLKPGANTINIVLNAQNGASITKSIVVNSSGIAPFRTTVDPQEGVAPLIATMTIVNRGNVAFQRIEIDLDDDGASKQTLTSLANGQGTVTMSFSTPGVHTIQTRVFDAGNSVIYSATRKIRVYSPADIGIKVVDVFRSMVDRLAASDAVGAVRYFTGDAQAQYSTIFGLLGSSLPAVAAQLGTLVDGVITEDTAELTLVRDTPTGKLTFMIYLIRGGDGLWRIESM